MEILGIGPLEALFILLIALIAVGPKDLGKAARSMGRLLNQMYKSEAWRNLSEASRSLRSLPNRLAREAALEELAEVKREMEQGVTAGIDQIKNLDLGTGPPDSGTSQDAGPSPVADQKDSPSDQSASDQSQYEEATSDEPNPSQAGSTTEDS